jgi:hypothetical protein
MFWDQEFADEMNKLLAGKTIARVELIGTALNFVTEDAVLKTNNSALDYAEFYFDHVDRPLPATNQELDNQS